jgi:hypothetical protein
MQSYQCSFSKPVLLFVQRRPTVETGQRRDPDDSVGQLPVRRIVGVVVRGTDDAGPHVAQALARRLPVKLVRIVVEHDRPVVAQFRGLFVEDRDRLDERQLSGQIGFDARDVLAQPHRLDEPCRGKNPAGRDLLAVVQHHARGAAVLDDDPVDAAAQSQFAAERPESFHQVPQDRPDAAERPREAFEENAAEHDAELAKGHVSLARVSVPHQRAQQHLDQQRVAERPPQHLAGRHVEMLLLQVVVVDQFAQQLLEAVLLVRKPRGDLGFEQPEVIAEPQLDARKPDRRTDLRRQGEILPAESQLPQQTRKRAAFGALGREIRHGMQAHVVVPSAQPVERVQPADRVVAFQNAYPLVVVGQADTGRQPRHSRADDDRVVHRVAEFVGIR